MYRMAISWIHHDQHIKYIQSKSLVKMTDPAGKVCAYIVEGGNISATSKTISSYNNH